MESFGLNCIILERQIQVLRIIERSMIVIKCNNFFDTLPENVVQ